MGVAFLDISMYIVVNLFLFSSWYIFLFRRKHLLSFTDRLIGTFTLCLTQIIFTEMLLGVLFKKLFAVPLFLLNVSISIIVLIQVIAAGRRKAFSENNKNTGVLLLRDIFNEFKGEAVRVFGVIRGDRILLLIFCLFSVSVGYMVFLGYLFPSYAWDSLWYHLPSVGYIMQSGAIQENPSPFTIDIFINIFPKNIEFFFLWNVVFLKSDTIVDLSQLFFTIAGVFTIYSMAVKLGVKKEQALYSSFLFFFAPIVILQSTTNYVDIAVSVLFLIAVNFLMCNDLDEMTDNMVIRGQQNTGRLPLLLAGLAAGILLGAKGSGPLFILTLSLMFLIRETARRFNLSGISEENHAKRNLMKYFYFFLMPAIFIGGYWYVKNWVLYSSPVYPMEVSFFDFILFKGKFSGIIDPVPHVLRNLSPLHSLFYVWLEKVEYYLYDSSLSGFGPVWFILLLPSIVIAVFYAIKHKRYNFLFLGMILISTFVVYPRNWNTRYVIFILGFGSLSFAITLYYFSKQQKVIKVVTVLLVMYTFLTANSPCIVPGKILDFIRLQAKDRIIARHAPFNIDLQASQDYGLWIWIKNNMLEGSALAFTFEPIFLFPLWNSDFSNKLVYIKSGSYEGWTESLSDNNISHVLARKNSIEDKWIEDAGGLIYNIPGLINTSKRLNERFKMVYSDENYRVYSLNNFRAESLN